MGEVAFTISGRKMRLTWDQVVQSMQGESPEPIKAHAVEIERRLFPVKQVFARATGLDRLDFTTHQARAPLQRLGFRVTRIS